MALNAYGFEIQTKVDLHAVQGLLDNLGKIDATLQTKGFTSLGQFMVSEIKGYIAQGGTQKKSGGAAWPRTHPKWVTLMGKPDDKPLFWKGRYLSSIGFSRIPTGVRIGSPAIQAARLHWGDQAIGLTNGTQFMVNVNKAGTIVPYASANKKLVRVKIQARPHFVIFQEDVDNWFHEFGPQLLGGK